MHTNISNHIYDSGFISYIYNQFDGFDESSSTQTHYRMPILQLPVELLLKRQSNKNFYYQKTDNIPKWKNECLDQLESISKLEDNWNENGAKKFSQNLLEKVKVILEDLKYEIELFPTANNSIQIECNNRKGDYLEFEIFENKIKEFLLVRKDNSTKTNFINSDQINGVLKNFYEF